MEVSLYLVLLQEVADEGDIQLSSDSVTNFGRTRELRSLSSTFYFERPGSLEVGGVLIRSG